LDPVALCDQVDPGEDLADRIRQDRQLHDVSALVVEGEADQRTLDGLLDNVDHRTFIAGSRPYVLRAAAVCSARGIDRVACVADRDFDGAALSNSIPCLVFTDNGDLEAMLFFSPALDRVIAQFASAALSWSGGIPGLRTKVSTLLEPISKLRRANAAGGWELPFAKVGLGGFVTASGALNASAYCQALVGRGGRAALAAVAGALSAKPCVCPRTNLPLLCGHDAMHASALTLQRGGLRSPPSWGTLEKALRVAVRVSDIATTGFWGELVSLMAGGV